jgi:hypothetical protein
MKMIITVLLLLVGAASYSRSDPHTKMVILSNKNHVLYFKVDKSLVGGIVEIYNENNVLLESDELPHTHTIIYFDEMPRGCYIVKVKKGDMLLEFSYENFQ